MMRDRLPLFLAACFTCLTVTENLSTRLAFSLSYPGDYEIAQLEDNATTPKPTLIPGSQGAEVEQLQTKLKQLGYFEGEIDGVYNESTRLAVEEFQRSQALAADGIVGSGTWQKLDAVEVKSTPTPAESDTSPVEEEKPLFSKRTLFLFGVFFAIVASLGVGIVFLLGMFKGKKKARRNLRSVLPEDNLTDEFTDDPELTNQLEEEQVTNEDRLDLDKNYHNGANLAVSTSEDGKSESNNLENSLPEIRKTSRLAKIDIIDELIKDLRQPDPNKRRKAIWELAQRADSRAMQPLVELMIDCDSQERSLILEAIAQISNRTLKPLNRALAISLQDDNPEVRKNAIRDLTRVYELISQVSRMLCNAADDPDPEVQETAEWALSRLNQLQMPASDSNLDRLSMGQNPPNN
ncbi:peptidoglycan-binding protein [Oscillatoria salina]|uniref:peptidoglycan-binding protein n=1 Tax=Oscillatoria salina TaxID=331517 RepID=UPI0013B93941|nr:peptidoglycan-binding protein [Oscillatoria salina]MBZ8182916.1 peptidoglycan-binding protein [Oscillatoria salina IIICB1]NET86577.1 peptidoglycan-binding protein [Kamptonema sp. SIO1D9]